MASLLLWLQRGQLSADGKSTCLFAGTGHDLRGPLRRGNSDQAVGEQVAAICARRADRYSELRTLQTGRKKVTRQVEMSHIGG